MTDDTPNTLVDIDWATFARMGVRERMKALDSAERQAGALLARMRVELVGAEVAEQAAAHGEWGARRRAAEALGLTAARVGQLLDKRAKYHGGGVTAEHVKALWHGAVDRLDRGPEYNTLTRLDLDALMRGSGIDDQDWDGPDPAAHMWGVLADCLTDSGRMEATDSYQALALDRVSEATDGGYPRLDEAIASALALGCSVSAIAAEAGVAEDTVLALRDGS